MESTDSIANLKTAKYKMQFILFVYKHYSNK